MNINVSLNHVEPAWISNELNYIVRNHIICKDGFDVSVQASEHHYCYPKETCKYHEYFELLCNIDKDMDLLKNYYDYDSGICTYVPKSVVEKLILRHGSIDWNLTPRKEK